MSISSGRILYVGTEDGLSMADTDTMEYRSRALALRGIGALRSPVRIDRDDPRRIYAATSRGGMQRSQDGGMSWQNIKAGVEFDAHSIAVMPDNPAVVIATSGQGVYKSTNGGDSFVECSDGLDRRYMAQLVFHPERPKVLFSAAAAVP